MKNRIKELEDMILYYDNLYWNENEQEISDIEYDKLVEELQKLDPKNTIIKKIHSANNLSNKKIKHKEPMLSLDKVYRLEDLIKWCKKVARNDKEVFFLQPKYDGCSADFSNGILATRGNGIEGENITSKLEYINKLSNDTHIRGEIIISKENFKKLEEKFPMYKTSRNACSGILHKDYLNDDYRGILTLIPFEYITKQITLSKLEILIESDWNEIIQLFQDFEYPTDGIVLKLADQVYSKSLGNTSHHPRGQMAFKFVNATKSSILREVQWQSGRRKLTPVGKIDAIEINGVIITRVNLHNYRYIIDKDICIGDSLIIERSGDVIPNVQSVIPGKVRKNIILKFCPECGFDVYYKEPEIYCSNIICPGKKLQLLLDSITRIGIKKLGRPTLKQLINNGCKNLIDIFNLKKENILKLDRFSEKSSQNLINEIQKIKNKGVYEWQILASLNIKDVGKRMSEILLKNRSFKELAKMSIKELNSINGVGYEKAIRIRRSIARERNYINNLFRILPILYNSTNEETKKTICFTGKMIEKRSYYESIAKSNGYNISKDVTKNLTVLICNDYNSTSSKIKKAKKLNIPIYSVEQWMEPFCKY